MNAKQIEYYALNYLDSLSVAAESTIDHELNIIEIAFDSGVKRALLSFKESESSIEEIINFCVGVNKD